MHSHLPTEFIMKNYIIFLFYVFIMHEIEIHMITHINPCNLVRFTILKIDEDINKFKRK